MPESVGHEDTPDVRVSALDGRPPSVTPRAPHEPEFGRGLEKGQPGNVAKEGLRVNRRVGR